MVDSNAIQLVDPFALGLDVAKISGTECTVLCPFHPDSHPSASFNLDKGLFYCFACGASANATQLAKLFGGFIRRTPAERIRGDAKGPAEWEFLLSFPLAYSNEYLHSRRVSDALVDQYQIRGGKDGVLIPLKDKHGNLTGMLERRYAKQPKYVIHGVRPQLWPFENLHSTPKEETLFVTEGVFGVLNAARAGVKAVALLSATGVASAVNFLSGRRVIAVFDPDYSGLFGAAKMVVHGHESLFPLKIADEMTLTEWRRTGSSPKTTRRVYDLADQAETNDERKRLVQAISQYRNRIKR